MRASPEGGFFSAAKRLAQTTSLLRYPVFVNDADYRGMPDMTKHRLLRKYLLAHFVAEVAQLKDAVFVGLGPQVQKALDRLIQQGVLNTDRVIGGMLHPSGNCTYRIKYLRRWQRCGQRDVGRRRGCVEWTSRHLTHLPADHLRRRAVHHP